MLVTGLGTPYKIALDLEAEKMYWADWETDKVQWAYLDGPDAHDLLLDGMTTNARAVALNKAAGKLYWSSFPAEGRGRIHRANLDGSGPYETLLIDYWFGAGIVDLTVDESTSQMYWCRDGGGDPDKLVRADLDGNSQVELYTDDDGNGPSGIALHATEQRMYWTNFGWDPASVQRACLDGTGVVDLVSHGSGNYTSVDIAIDEGAGKMYWTDTYEQDIFRANLDGTKVEVVLMLSGGLQGIALDLRPDADIPAVSEWGLMIMALLVLAVGTVVIRRRSPVAV